MKTLSIIIPHYNNWHKLRELLSTIPITNWIEVIVVDDKSEDQEKNISNLQKEFTNVIFLSNKTSVKGAGKARNIGLEIATGEWLLFADSDDLFLPEMVEKIQKYMEGNNDIIYFIPTSFIEDTDELSTRHKPYENYVNNYLENSNRYNELKLRYYYVVPWSKLIRKQIVDKNKIYFEEILVSNDLLFSAKVGFYADKILATSEKIYSVRENEGSMTTDISEQKFDLRFDAWIDYVDFLNKNMTEEDLQLININSGPQIYKVITSKLGFKKFKEVISKCRNHGIKIIDKRIFNPFFIWQKLKN